MKVKLHQYFSLSMSPLASSVPKTLKLPSPTYLRRKERKVGKLKMGGRLGGRRTGRQVGRWERN